MRCALLLSRIDPHNLAEISEPMTIRLNMEMLSDEWEDLRRAVLQYRNAEEEGGVTEAISPSKRNSLRKKTRE